MKPFHLEFYDCVFSNESTEETSRQLLWVCCFSRDCWNNILPPKKLGSSILDDTLLAHQLLPSQMTMEIVIHGYIWFQRNGNVFRNEVPNVYCWKFKLKRDLKLLEHEIKAKT
ncbi:hypothetical protein CFC21_055417 [Triticum aestivum]|uniref:Uncharacterized protein n=2 Tax=Triticum aestivum TaxID=4565 RepID=A0A3B6I2E0_WHEAT|nr:hypothetical protein CFC21_055417 [Triticum aestivum]